MTTATWKAQPLSGAWNTANNWNPATVPVDIAMFAVSAQTAISFIADNSAQVNSIEFAADAPAFTFTLATSTSPSLTLAGPGVINQSQKQQSFIVAATSQGYQNPQLRFVNSASAGGADMFYCAGPETEQGYGGGVICFCNSATAGAASFKVWTGAAKPPQHSTVGGEVSFCDTSSAGSGRFTVYGSLGADGDTFGNVVFHNDATADSATFTNVGGTVAGGDGGNTQFYGDSSAANGHFYNWGGSHTQANGGDVAFDATATGGQGYFYNYAARAAGAYGGVTSFNNNPPDVATSGASAGDGSYFNYGAREGELGGGGHLEFSAKYGSPTAANATIINYGSTIESTSSAGHTIFSITLPTAYFPSAGNATIWNHPGASAGGAAGFTEFSVYGSGSASNMPTAGAATLLNLGAYTEGGVGGYTVFSGIASAANATLIAYGGSNGGKGGRIVFYDDACGSCAKVQLFGNGELDIADHSQGVTIDTLELTGGIITVQLGQKTTALTVSNKLHMLASYTSFEFYSHAEDGFEFNTAYTILIGADLSGFSEDQFRGNSIEGIAPAFTIEGDCLKVSFLQS